MTLTALQMKEACDRIAISAQASDPSIVEATPALQELVKVQIEQLSKALQAHGSQVIAIKANDRLSDKAKAQDMETLQAKTRRTLESILDRSGLAASMERTEAEMTNSLVRARKQFTLGKDPAEALVARLDQGEARAEARREREEARQLHRAKLAEARKNREVLSDEERQFIDPVATRFLEACKTYDQDKESFISAMERPPYGIAVLSQDVVDQGRDLIKTVVCRDLLEARAALAVRQDQAQELARIIEGELARLPGPPAQPEPRPFMSDQERQQATA